MKKCNTHDFGSVEELSLRHEKIVSMKGIDSFVSLTTLNLDHNKITQIQSLRHLRVLEYLSLRNNQIDSLRGLEGMVELRYANFSMNKITTIREDDFKQCKGITELDLADNPIRSFEGLCYLKDLDTLDVSRNKNIKDLLLLPDLEYLSKLKAENCDIKNIKFIHSKFPSLNIVNLKSNDIRLYEHIQDIKKIEYLAEIDIRFNPIAKTAAIQDRVVADVPDLEVFNQIELLEPGYKFKVMNQEIRKYLEDTKETVEQQQEGIIDEAFSNIKDKNGEKMDPDKLTKKFEEVEENQMKNEAEMIRAQLSISANLQPLMRDKNNLKELEEATNDILITESVEYSKKLKKDYSEIRSSFRNVMNHLRFDEFGTFDRLKSTQNQDLKDPYLEMQEEILKINQEQKKKGFITSYSEANDSGDEEQLVEEIPLKNTDKLNKSASKPSQKRSVSIRSKKSLPFRSSAGFNKKNQKPDLTGKSTSKLMRAGSARKRKLPPTGKNKEELNQLRELKIDEEKDKILSEFNKIVSKTSTDFKKPKFPNSSRKKVLQPIKSYGKSSSVISDSEAGVTALKNITKYTKPSMLAAQNEAIASILSNKN